MQCFEKQTPNWGRVLWITDERTEMAVALDFGIRVVYLAAAGCENLFYEQPADRSDSFTTPDGWILYGGHRIWLAPESDDSYYPDNEPVCYNITGDTIHFTQNADPWLHVRKSMSVTYREDGSIAICQEMENLSDQIIHGAVWGVNTLDAGGEAEIAFGCQSIGGFNPQRVVSLWSNTSLGDPRLNFSSDYLYAKHMPLDAYLKVGLYSNPGRAIFRNKGQILELTFGAEASECYPDNGCNFELFICNQFMELESLGMKMDILPGQCATHTEVWHLQRGM